MNYCYYDLTWNTLTSHRPLWIKKSPPWYFTGLRLTSCGSLVPWLDDRLNSPAEGCSWLAVGKATGSKHQNEPGPQRPLEDFTPKTHVHSQNHYSCTSCSRAPWACNSASHYNLESKTCHWHHFIKDLAVINTEVAYCVPDSRETGCPAAPSTSTLTHIFLSIHRFLEMHHLYVEASVEPAYKRRNHQCVSHPADLGVHGM